MARQYIGAVRIKQIESTAYSSAVAEIYALSEAVRCAKLYAWRAEELGISVTWPLVLQVDSKGSISFQGSTCAQSRLRGVIDLREAWVKELRDRGVIVTSKIHTDQQLADCMTKCLPNYKFRRALRLIYGDQETKKTATFLAEMARVCE